MLAAMFLYSCGNSRPSGVLAEDKMQEVLWDYVQADVFAKDFISKDSALNDTAENIKLQKQVFAAHKITREQFYKSYEYYLHHDNDMKVMLDSLLARQTRKKALLDSQRVKKPLIESKIPS
ncbi:MAG: hypothetical protein JWQ27_2794 [Ferruginibacter sp.]|nr:hypothetical protein [Ferruginibacter sp.]